MNREKRSQMPRMLVAYALALVLSCPSSAHARIPKPVFDTTVRLLLGAAAAFSAAHSAEAQQILKAKEQVLEDLKRNGIDPYNGAIYSLYFRVDPASSQRWFLNPNVYTLVQIEGHGDFVPATIATGYKGQPYTITEGHQGQT